MDFKLHVLSALLLVCIYSMSYGEGLFLNAEQRALLKRLLNKELNPQLSTTQKGLACKTGTKGCGLHKENEKKTAKTGMKEADILRNLNQLKAALAQKYRESKASPDPQAVPVKARVVPKVAKEASTKEMSLKEVVARRKMKAMEEKLMARLKSQMHSSGNRITKKATKGYNLKRKTKVAHRKIGKVASYQKKSKSASTSSTTGQLQKLLHDKQFLRILAATARHSGYTDKGFWDWVTDAVDTVTDTASDVLDTIGDVAGDALDTVSDVASDAMDTVGDVAGGVIDEVGDFLNDTGVLDAAADVGDAVGSVAGDVVDSVGGFIGDVVDTVNQTDFGEVASDVVDTAGDAWDAATDAVEGVIDDVEEYLNETGVLDAAGSVADAAGNIVDEATNVLSGVADSAADAVGGVVDSASDVLDGVVDSATDALSLLNETGVVDTAGDIVGSATDIIGDAGQAIGDAAGDVLDFGTDLWEDLWRLYQSDPKIQAAVDKNPAIRKKMVSHIRSNALRKLNRLRTHHRD